MDSSSSNTYVHPHFDRILFRECLWLNKRIKRGDGVVFIEKMGAWKCLVINLIQGGNVLSKG